MTVPFPPDTRASLILRLSNAADVEAWDEFVLIYEPLILRLGRRHGLQEADAEELVQEVFLAVSRAVSRWNGDPARGRFRGWLFRIARNLLINVLTRRRFQVIGSGDSAMRRLLDEQAAPSNGESRELDLELRRELFRRAAQVVRDTVSETTWQAFWQTSVEARPIADVAQALGITVGGVYIARSRVMARFRDEVRRLTVE